MRLIKYILCNFIGRFIMVYIDDILNYSKNMDEHVKHLRNILDFFVEKCLYANMKSITFA
jgi:hypothetical protein